MALNPSKFDPRFGNKASKSSKTPPPIAIQVSAVGLYLRGNRLWITINLAARNLMSQEFKMMRSTCFPIGNASEGGPSRHQHSCRLWGERLEGRWHTLLVVLEGMPGGKVSRLRRFFNAECSADEETKADEDGDY